MSHEEPILRYAYGEVDARPFDHNALAGIDLPKSFTPYFQAEFAKMSPQEREHALDHSIAFSPSRNRAYRHAVQTHDQPV